MKRQSLQYRKRYALETYGEPWETLILRLYEQHQSLAKVAALLHASPYTVRKDLINLGVTLRSPGGPNNIGKIFEQPVLFRGRRQTITAWAEEYGLNPVMVKHRIYAGWPLYRALETPKQVPAKFTFEGKTMTLKAWSRHVQIPYWTLTRRINDGWSFERTITTPLGSNHRKRRATHVSS